jgi:Zn-dependent peptidase ImmA (M78 family)
MQKYKNEGLNKIAEKYPDINFSDLDGVLFVPVGGISEKLGIDVVFGKDLPHYTCGWLNHKTKTIFVNEIYNAYQNAFTIAHCLGHFILHYDKSIEFDHKGSRIQQWGKDMKARQIECNRDAQVNDFALKLMLPQEDFIKYFTKYNKDFKKLAHYFMRPPTLCEARAFNLGLIDNV